MKPLMLAKFFESFFLFLANRLPRFRVFDWVRCYILWLAGVKMDGRYTIASGIDIRPFGGASNITIGRGTFINSRVRFAAKSTVQIGMNCSVGPNVMFETVNHGLIYDPVSGRRGSSSKPIVIEDGVWIGAGVIVTQGVTIGAYSVVAAGSVVTKDVPSNILCGGVPARVIRSLS